MSDPRFISDALELPAQALFYQVSARLAQLYPDRVVVEGSDCDFDLFEYVREGLCTIRRKEGVHGQVTLWWSDDDGIREAPRNVWYVVDWRGEELEVLVIDSPDAPTYHWIVAESEGKARDFYAAVCSFRADARGEVLIFEGGRFEGSTGLYRGLKEARFEDLILPGRLREELREDLDRFFGSRATYEALGAPWKRGLLLTGPPGNGKTHTIKALVAAGGRPCLYVKSFKSERWTEETAIRRIFERARAQAPCLLVLEDLDALVTDENRSFLLNELDGFARNTGLVVIATTNHPERLDPALRDRPSRFDRKYHFPLPARAERLRFLRHWNDGRPADGRLGPTALELAAEQSDGFSFAYLKELMLSSVLGLAAAQGATLDDVLLDQLAALRAQMGPWSAR